MSKIKKLQENYKIEEKSKYLLKLLLREGRGESVWER